MAAQEKYSLLRTIIKTLGLSQEAVDDIIERIEDWLTDKKDKSSNIARFPYFLRDDFLSPAEQSFYFVMRTSVAEFALICPKVGLGDLFYVRSRDNSIFRTYTNKIDRKHVDFLLCDPKTAWPVLGIELDDKSHQREDRKKRDEFVEKVFMAASLPLLRIPVREAYGVAQLTALVRPYFEKIAIQIPTQNTPPKSKSNPVCPNCGKEMILRTTKTGFN